MDGQSSVDIVASPSKHGGVRKGAGRKRNDYDARWFEARGISPLLASEILAKVADERKVWKRILESTDDRVVLQAMMFLVSMRDGKPAQQINVTSTSVNVNADSIAKARAIVAEIRGSAIATLPECNGIVPPRLGVGETDSVTMEGKKVNGDIMLCGDEGGKAEGE